MEKDLNKSEGISRFFWSLRNFFETCEFPLEHDGKIGDSESYADDDLEFHVDEVLHDMDGNRDGFISYIEFITTPRKA